MKIFLNYLRTKFENDLGGNKIITINYDFFLENSSDQNWLIAPHNLWIKITYKISEPDTPLISRRKFFTSKQTIFVG